SGLYAELRARTGLDPGWRGVGGLRLATTPERVEELRRQASSATTYGLGMELLGPPETVDRLPLLNAADVRPAGWLPGYGWPGPRPVGCGVTAGWRRPSSRRRWRPVRPRSASASSPAGGSPRSASRAAGSPASRPTRGRSPPRSWSTRPAPPPGTSAASPGCR